MRIILFFIFVLTIFSGTAQLKDSTLNEAIVQGFETDRPLLETAGGVSILRQKELKRFDNQNFVPVLNTLPGVKMDERSPGSYRLAIRGSSLRAPFGVRNVKVYWNEIPLTDANGSTYLNAIDLATIGSIEVLKGPAGSAYGAGTGGAVLMNGSTADAGLPIGLQLNMQEGSFGQRRRVLQWGNATEKSNQQLVFSNQSTEGYRDHTASLRTLLNWKSSYEISDKRTINMAILAANLRYETPGGLTEAQFLANPRAARPRAGQIAGAEEQQAGIFQKNGLVGISQEYRFNKKLSNQTAVFGGMAEVRNPFITNYEKRFEISNGFRSKMVYNMAKTKLTAGYELLRTFSNIHNYGNRAGKQDTLQFEDEIVALQRFGFLQAELDLPHNFLFTVGGSLNLVQYDYKTVSKPKQTDIAVALPIDFAPRVTLLKKFNNKISVYLTYSEGFTPPSLSEYVTSSQRNVNPVLLKPETANQVEIGSRGKVFEWLSFDITAYQVNMQNTVVRRVDEAGRQFFVNAGNTNQKGLETSLKALLVNQKEQILNHFSVFANGTFNNYTFGDYTQLKTDLSGKNLPGVPNQVLVFGLDLELKNKLILNATLNATGKIPLTDANTVYAADYQNLRARLAYRFLTKRIGGEFYLGIDNALNQTYSLGNDFNAVGNRFFNVAPARNYFVGLSLKI